MFRSKVFGDSDWHGVESSDESVVSHRSKFRCLSHAKLEHEAECVERGGGSMISNDGLVEMGAKVVKVVGVDDHHDVGPLGPDDGTHGGRG